MEHTSAKDIIALVLLGVALFGLVKYIDYRFNLVMAEVESYNSGLSTLKQEFESSLANLENTVFGTTSNLKSVLEQEQEKNNSLKDELSGIGDAVKGLEKLSITDKELLKKYSKVYFLNEHYVPISLSSIDEDLVNKKGQNLQIHSNVLPYLEDLISEANSEEGLALQALSAYRSFGTQSALKANYTLTYGAGTANQFSADQGYSEHQLGTTLDFTTKALNGNLVGFEKTPEYNWLKENAHKYGFILSYPQGNTYYKFEPWHWRYVGVDLATRLYDDNMNFYDLDQRIIDSYLAKIFD